MSLITLVYMVPKGAPKLFQHPDSKIRFFVWLSGFSKTLFLESTHPMEFLGLKIFPDKKCPVSGFCLKCLLTAFLYIGPCLVMFWNVICSNFMSRTLKSGFLFGSPVFYNCIFDTSSLQRISWGKNYVSR